jgi:DNA-binding transcriptional ArsR family regulator
MPYERTVEHLGFKCLGPTITPDRILRLRQEVRQSEELQALRHVLPALSGPMRLKILYLLHREPELCVCDLADILDESVSAVSHQLRVLRRHNLVTTRRDAKTIFYAQNAPVVQRYINLEQELVPV